MPSQETLDKYEKLLEDIIATQIYGEPFIQAAFLGMTFNANSPIARNAYIKSMGKHFNIDQTKVDCLVAFLPV